MNSRSITSPQFFSPLLVWVLDGMLVMICALPPVAWGHEGHEVHAPAEHHATTGYPVRGASFQVFLEPGEGLSKQGALTKDQATQAVETVVQALEWMVQHRSQYQRFDEALNRGVLQKVIIEPQVINREGKAFPFLVVRTPQKGKVNLLISANHLVERGYLGHPDQLVPPLAREFQWVLVKAETRPRPKAIQIQRDLEHAPLQTNKAIAAMSGEQREHILESLFQTYLTTVDAYKSLLNQPYY
ncbi:MAG: hypothetical protein D6704_03480, partial [Nitrospirae bacterium]